VEPLTPDDIADIVVFAAGRRENVVLADTLVFPNHQVSDERVLVGVWMCLLTIDRLLQRLCIEKLLGSDYHDRDCSYRYQSNVKTGTKTEYVTQKDKISLQR
jgi:hypothetical protein